MKSLKETFLIKENLLNINEIKIFLKILSNIKSQYQPHTDEMYVILKIQNNIDKLFKEPNQNNNQTKWYDDHK